MKQYITFFAGVLLLVMTLFGCTEVYDDFSNGSDLPATITTGDVISVTWNKAEINFGTNYQRYAWDWENPMNTVGLLVSKQSDCSQTDEGIGIYTYGYSWENRRNDCWTVENLVPNTTYYYREVVFDAVGQMKKGEVKQFTTGQPIVIEAEFTGSDTYYLYFKLRVYNYKGTPQSMGMFFYYSSSINTSNAIRYFYNNTPTNDDGMSPWEMGMTVPKSGFEYRYQSFWFMPYLQEDGEYITGTPQYCSNQ